MTDVERLQTMIGIMQTQRNIANDQIVQLGAQNAALQQEVAQLKAQLANGKNKKSNK